MGGACCRPTTSTVSPEEGRPVQVRVVGPRARVVRTRQGGTLIVAALCCSTVINAPEHHSEVTVTEETKVVPLRPVSAKSRIKWNRTKVKANAVVPLSRVPDVEVVEVAKAADWTAGQTLCVPGSALEVAGEGLQAESRPPSPFQSLAVPGWRRKEQEEQRQRERSAILKSVGTNAAHRKVSAQRLTSARKRREEEKRHQLK